MDRGDSKRQEDGVIQEGEPLSFRMYEGEGEYWTQRLFDQVFRFNLMNVVTFLLQNKSYRNHIFAVLAGLVIYSLSRAFNQALAAGGLVGNSILSFIYFAAVCSVLFAVVIPIFSVSSTETLHSNQPASKSKPEKQPLRLCIDNRWYDLTNWQAYHPGGAAILHHLDNKDATNAFYSLHSKEAVARLKKMGSKPATEDIMQPSALERNFCIFRQQLEAEGWFERDVLWDIFYIGSILCLTVAGTYFSWSHPFVAIVCLGVAMQQAGWCAHDYIHQRGNAALCAGYFLATINSLSRSWWSEKHNTHHVYPNTMGVDMDIANDPIFHLWYPAREKDHAMRSYQHVYYLLVYSLLYISWRLQSLENAWGNRKYLELATFAVNYFWLFCLPWYVALGAVLLGGFLVGVVVTATHQSEEIFKEKDRKFEFVRDQFLTTRNAYISNPVLQWLWGGMQVCLQIHLL